MSAPHPGKIILVAGLYCAGKTTLIKEALQRLPMLTYITTYTTREPRPAERRDDTHEYEFVSRGEYARLRSRPGWSHTEARGEWYGEDAGEVRRQVAQGRHFIVVKTMNPEQLAYAREVYGDESKLLFLNADYQTCRERVLAPGSGRSEKYLSDPTQSPGQAARIRELADLVYEPLGPLEADQAAFTEFVRAVIYH